MAHDGNEEMDSAARAYVESLALESADTHGQDTWYCIAVRLLGYTRRNNAHDALRRHVHSRHQTKANMSPTSTARPFQNMQRITLNNNDGFFAELRSPF